MSISAAAQAHDFAVEVDVFAAGEFRIEARAEFEQRGDAPARHHASRGGLQDAADDLQQRALAAAVGTHQAEHLALFDLEADVLAAPRNRCGARPRRAAVRAGGRWDGGTDDTAWKRFERGPTFSVVDGESRKISS